MLRNLLGCFPRHLSTHLNQTRQLEQMACLYKRSVVDPANLTADELKSLMWSAIDLKYLPERKKGKLQEALKNYNATLIMSKLCIRNYVAVTSVLQRLGCTVNCIVSKEWESGNPCDLGRTISSMTDLIIVDACKHENLVKLSDGATVPVINLDSRLYKPIKVLTDLMTVQERYGYLQRLTIGWVGPPCSYLYTYLLMCARLGMHIRFSCLKEEVDKAGPGFFEKVMKIGVAHNAEVAEFESYDWRRAIHRAHVVVTTKHDEKCVVINKKELEDAAVEWTFAHDLPRSSIEVTEDVICSKNSIVWDSCENFKWMMMATALNVLVGYDPEMQSPPDFEGCNTEMKI